MSKELDTAINKIKQCFETTELFGANYSLDTACRQYLELKDYKVIKEPSLEGVKTVDALVNKFYDLMEFYYDSKCRKVASPKKDIALLSNFVEQRRIALDTTFTKALAESMLIVKGLFVFKDDIGLDRPIGTWIFGTDKCKWITDKVIDMLNNNKQAENEFKVRQLSSQYEAETEHKLKGML